ncbi:N-acetylglucosamine kinase [Clostridium gasigenes]|uniref:ATPase n=1 Tax=Clostridium gasigenes TaxID=94869 RepID=A0A1H0VTA8_9CLOT|nr:BadF/BadG/BcrA/BcrD ATPase family protein [Clostridium gasigenes]MBB6622520.1 ATPase [Clostridium gasigenes]MBB6714167.1 ATPase [Clostridium gasigenes]MBU3088500.1 ATPase [Clostridium gasigenes]SDP81481.1 BadF-type ATPase [Clostridium gasigenes]
MEYVIGVDGGGTKTESVAYDLEGNVLASSLTGFGNLVNDKKQALKNVISGIEELLNKLGRDGLKGLYLGLAGSEVGENAKIVRQEIKTEFEVDSVIMNDGDLALKALLKGEDGILVIAGTGSTSFGVNGKKQARCGGWGQILGDEGSAYKISIEAYKQMIHENDFGLELSKLSKNILANLGVEKVEDILGIIYSSTKDEIANVAELVSIEAEEGNEVAINILKTEGIAIAKAAERIFNKLEFDKCSIGLVGSAIKKSVILRETFETYLKENINIIEFIDVEVSPAKGAYYLYKKENKE